MTKINLFFKFIYLSCFFASFMLKRLIAKLPPPPNPIGSGCHIRRQERSICSDSSAAAAAGEEFYRSHLCHDLHLHHLHLQPSSCALIEVLVVRERHFKGGPSFLWSSSSSPLTIFICVGWSAGEERAFPFFLKCLSFLLHLKLANKLIFQIWNMLNCYLLDTIPCISTSFTEDGKAILSPEIWNANVATLSQEVKRKRNIKMERDTSWCSCGIRCRMKINENRQSMFVLLKSNSQLVNNSNSKKHLFWIRRFCYDFGFWNIAEPGIYILAQLQCFQTPVSKRPCLSHRV